MIVKFEESIKSISIDGAYIDYDCECGCNLFVCDAQTVSLKSGVATNYFSCANCYDTNTRIVSRLTKIRILKGKKWTILSILKTISLKM